MSLAEVLVVEDEQFTRTTLNVTLQALGFGVVGLCSTAKEALEIVGCSPVDVALLDLDLGPGPSGIDVAHALRHASPGIGIVLLTTFSDPRLHDPQERQLPRGARYLVKTYLDDPEVLRSTIIDTKQQPLRETSFDNPRSPLTFLQLEVLRLVASGLANSEIAEIQGVTDKAVERTVQRIAEALGIRAQSGNKRVLLTRAYADLTGKSLPS
jgi:two-component system, NarL family, invasion response regulator UvrY